MIKQTAITLIGAAAFVGSAQAEIEYSLGAGVHSHYVWRGDDQGGGQLVDTSFELSTEAAEHTVTFNVWNASTGNGGVDETDFTLSASKEIEGIGSYTVGAIYYAFPDGGDDSTELFVGLSKDLGGVEVSATYYKLVDNGDSSYIELGASKGFTVGDVDASFGIAVGIKDEEVSHYQFTLGTEYGPWTRNTFSIHQLLNR